MKDITEIRKNYRIELGNTLKALQQQKTDLKTFLGKLSNEAAPYIEGDFEGATVLLDDMTTIEQTISELHYMAAKLEDEVVA